MCTEDQYLCEWKLVWGGGESGTEGGTKKLNVCTGDQYLCEWKLVWGGMGVDHGMNACVWLIYQ